MTELSKLTDLEFIGLSEEFVRLSTVQEKVGLIYRTDPYNLSGLFYPLNRTIKKKKYSFGFKLTNTPELEKIVNYAIGFIVDEWTEAKKMDLNKRINECKTDFERLSLLDEEVECIRRKAYSNSAEHIHYKDGYNAAKRKIPAFKYPNYSPIWIDEVDSNIINLGFLFLLSNGFSDFETEVYCAASKKIINEQINSEISVFNRSVNEGITTGQNILSEKDNTFLSFENEQQKIIFSHLKKEYAGKGAKDLIILYTVLQSLGLTKVNITNGSYTDIAKYLKYEFKNKQSLEAFRKQKHFLIGIPSALLLKDQDKIKLITNRFKQTEHNHNSNLTQPL